MELKYVILDYGKSTLIKNRKNKYFKFCEQLQKFKQYRQFTPIRKDVDFMQMELVYICLPASPTELKQFKEAFIKKKILRILGGENNYKEYRFLAIQPELMLYVPAQIEWSEETDEINIMVAEKYLQNMICRDSHLLFVDDGTKDVERYMKALLKNWNYVTVCSNRHEQLETLYREIYEEEGLMVQCIDLKKSRRTDEISKEQAWDKENIEPKTVVIDLTTDWHGIHRLYPKNAYVFDVTFSKEKEKYLQAKQIRLKEYKQALNLKEKF